MDAVILSIGTELTTGQCLDTNAAWIGAALTNRGVRVLQHVTVDDDLARIVAAIRGALDSAQLVVATGGLGPTADDLTREAVARAIGQPLESNPAAAEEIRVFFERWNRPMHAANAVQAMIPRNCRVIRNDGGTAPGIWHNSPEVDLFALPGVPGEMKAMFAATIAPYIETRCGAARTKEAALHCFGMNEARIGELLGDLMTRGRNPLVGTTASRGIITIRILASAPTEAAAVRLMATEVAEVRARLGSVVFGEGDDTLERAVGYLLRDRVLTVATAESCTGGLVAKRLTDVPGSSEYFVRGYVTYSNASKSELLGVSAELIERDGAVSEAVARAMALGCRSAARCDYAVGITGIAGPTGARPPDKPVGLVYVALAGPGEGEVAVKRLGLGDHLTREEIRDRAASVALNLLRLRLLGIEKE